MTLPETLAEKAMRQIQEGDSKLDVAVKHMLSEKTEPNRNPAAEIQNVGAEEAMHLEGPPTVKDLEEASAIPAATTLAAMNADHFVSIEGSQTFVFIETTDRELGHPTLQRIAVNAFKQLHSHQTIKLTDGHGNTKTIGRADAWLKSPQRRTYSAGMAMLPTGNVPPDTYNLWRGFGAAPKTGATYRDAAPALDHIHKVICGSIAVYSEYLIGWLASGVQYPDRQAEVAVILQGGRGTGKGTLGRWFRDLYGAHGMHIQQSRHLVGNFNAHLRTALALFVDESFFVGDKAGNSVLKSLITEDQMTIERKGIDAGSVRNRLKIMMATNDAHAVLAGSDERRYFVLEVAETVKQDHAYFNHLAHWWENGGIEAFLGYLLQYDISRFNIRAVPNTAALETQKLASMSAFETWLYEKLSAGQWTENTTIKQLADEFSFHVHHRGLRYEKTSVQSVGLQLRKLLTVVRNRASGDDREWRIHLPNRLDARAQFMQSMGIEIIGWGDEPDHAVAEPGKFGAADAMETKSAASH